MKTLEKLHAFYFLKYARQTIGYCTVKYVTKEKKILMSIEIIPFDTLITIPELLVFRQEQWECSSEKYVDRTDSRFETEAINHVLESIILRGLAQTSALGLVKVRNTFEFIIPSDSGVLDFFLNYEFEYEGERDVSPGKRVVQKHGNYFALYPLDKPDVEIVMEVTHHFSAKV